MPRKNKFIISFIGFYFIIVMHIYINDHARDGFFFLQNSIGMIFTAMVIICIHWRERKSQKIYLSRALPYLPVAIFLLGVSVIGSLGSREDLVWIPLLCLLTGFVFYVSLLQCAFSQKDKMHILALILIAVIAEALLGVAQLYEFFSATLIHCKNRPCGAFQQVNTMASFMATGLVIALFLWQQRDSSRSVLWLAGGGLILAPCLLLLNGSHIGLLAALTITPFQLYAAFRSDPQKGSQALWLLSAGILLAVMSLTVRGDNVNVTPLLHKSFPVADDDFYPPHPLNGLLHWRVEERGVALCGLAAGITGFSKSIWKGLRFGSCGGFLRFCASPWLLPMPVLFHMVLDLSLFQSTVHGILLIVLLRICEKKTAVTIRITLYPVRIGIILLARLLMMYMVFTLWIMFKDYILKD